MAKVKLAKEDDMVVAQKQPVLMVKYCRGRLGGSAFLLTVIQRARWQGREVLVIDGDENSKTLRTYYPADRPGGAILADGTDATAFKSLMLEQMEAIASDRTSRVVDISGGSRDMDEVMSELNLSEYCDDYGIRLVAVSMLGPDREDFLHAAKAVDLGLRPKDMLLVLNQGVLRGGNPDQAFLPIVRDDAFKALKAEGAKAILMPKLTVMNEMRDLAADFYEVASGRGPDGKMWVDRNNKPRALWSHMSRKWTEYLEGQFATAGIADILP